MITGWWYAYPSEKYEFVSWDDNIPNMWENKKKSKLPTSYKGSEQIRTSLLDDSHFPSRFYQNINNGHPLHEIMIQGPKHPKLMWPAIQLYIQPRQKHFPTCSTPRAQRDMSGVYDLGSYTSIEVE